MKNSFAILSFSALTTLLVAANAFAGPVYRDTFQFCSRTGVSSLEANLLVGWKALRKGKSLGDGGTIKSSEIGSPNVLKAFRSFPVGQTSGNLLWTKKTSGLAIFTDEFSFDIGSITRVKYDQRFDGLDLTDIERDGSKIAFLIGNIWYISDQTFGVKKRSVWETVSVELSSLTYGMIVGSSLVGPASPKITGVNLPASGTATAFGVYIPEVNDRVRIDNYTLEDNAADTAYGPGEEGNLTPCPAVNAQGTPIPSATPPVKKDAFCSETQLQSLGSLKINKKLKKDIVTNLPAKTLKGKRDQSLLSLISLANPRLDLLTNVIVSDYDRVNGVLRLPSTVRPDGFIGAVSSTVDTPLDKFSRFYMERYLRRYAKDENLTKPLFPQVNRGTEKLISSALCSKQLRRLIRLRAERVGIRIKFND